MIVFEKEGRTQQVEEREKTRIAILERTGWQRSEIEPVEAEPTGAEGYETQKTDAELARIAETARIASRRRVEQKPNNVEYPVEAKRDITGQQDTPLTGELPADFPGYEALKDAGVGTYEALREIGDVAAVKGVTKGTAGKIRDALR